MADAATNINPKAFTGAKPHTHQTNLRHLHPAIVKRLVPLPNFVNWKWQLNEKRDAWTKVPYQPRDPTKRAATNDKGTWGTYAEAVVNVEAEKADGIGFCLVETNICAFDIDDCRDLATGEIDPAALALIGRCGATYVEKTVSGTGLRIIGLGGTTYVNRKQKINGSKVSIESYRNCARYITISGMTFGGVKPKMPDLGNIDAVITSVVEELDHPTDAGNAKADNTKDTALGGEARIDTFTDDPFGFRTEAALPPDLARLIRDGVPIAEDRSAAFYHAVKWLKDERWSLDAIIELLARYPDGIASKYGSRLATEAVRAFGKPDKSNGSAATGGQPPGEQSATAAEIEIIRLAKLALLDYEQQRKAAAERLDVRASVLDQLVRAERERLGLDGDADSGMQGRAISFPEPEPWPEPVDGAELLDGISKAIGEHVIMPETSRDACALWAAHTFLTDATMISPRLAITSPTRGCGKTTALDVISQLVLRPLPAANVSASAIFRVVEGFRPTLMIDEADSFLRDNEELRGVLNSGHRKGGAVLRNVGDDHEPRSFSTYSACAIALIGQLPPTLTDRSVPITLTRRKRDEAITPFRLDRVDHLVVLARQLARWTTDNAVAIAATEPTMPAGIYNRAADNWRSLLAIAEVAGGKWPTRGQTAALKSVAADIDDASLLELLLRDIRDIFAKRAANKVEPADRIPSVALAEALAEIEGRPWAEYGKNDKPITQNKLARLLRPLVITPENIRIDDKVSKGYLLERFKEVFARYLASEGASEPLQRYKADETGTSDVFQSATAESCVAHRKCEKPNNDGPCSVVADQKGGQGKNSLNVSFLGIEPFAPCVHCGKADGVVHHVRDNRHLDRPSVNLHEACVPGWLARDGNGDGDGAAICAHCGLSGDLFEVFFSNRPMVRLHRECKKFYRVVLDEGEKDRTDSVEDAPEDRTCAQCNGEIDGTERLVSVSGHAAWLHLECERFWVRALGERER